jgi:Domain of unknown function (DUF5753)
MPARISHPGPPGKRRSADLGQLVQLAENSQNRMMDWRPVPVGLASMQRSIGEWEAGTQTFRLFEPSIVTGLFQTDGYARAVLAGFQRLTAADGGDPGESAALAAVSGRVQRQEIVADEDKTFSFVMAETVLRHRICPPAEMLAQIARLRELAARSNVTIKIVPDEALWELPPQHGFVLLDDRLVVVDLYNTGLTSRGRLDAQRYRTVFETFERTATPDIEPILDRYEDLNVELLRRPGPDRPQRHAG